MKPTIKGSMFASAAPSLNESHPASHLPLDTIQEESGHKTGDEVAKNVLRRQTLEEKNYSPEDIEYSKRIDTVYHCKTTFYKLLIDLFEDLEQKRETSYLPPSTQALFLMLKTHITDIHKLYSLWKKGLPILEALHRDKKKSS